MKISFLCKGFSKEEVLPGKAGKRVRERGRERRKKGTKQWAASGKCPASAHPHGELWSIDRSSELIPTRGQELGFTLSPGADALRAVPGASGVDRELPGTTAVCLCSRAAPTVRGQSFRDRLQEPAVSSKQSTQEPGRGSMGTVKEIHMDPSISTVSATNTKGKSTERKRKYHRVL